MSKYTTGEIAKLCNVSVRTVQFYDTKKILIPTEITDSGRRLYSDEDIKKLQWICLLKSLGLNLTSIKEIVTSDYALNTLLLIIDEQYKKLETEIKEKQIQIEAIKTIKLTIKSSETIPTELLKDIEHIMKNTKKLKKTRYIMLLIGILVGLIEYSTLLFGIIKGHWAPFIIGMCFVIAIAIWFIKYYRTNIIYICPKCNFIFKPKLIEFIFANHTLTTRKLKCTHCKCTSNCVETTDNITKPS